MNEETHFKELSQHLNRWTARRRQRDALIWAPRGALAGLLLAVVVATVARLRPFLTNQEVAYVAIGLAATGLLISLILLLAQRYSPAQQARFADRQFRLQERASAAVDIHEGYVETSPVLAQQQLADTLAVAGQVNVRQALPLQANRRDWLVMAVAAVLLAAAVLLPNPQEAPLKKARAIDKAIAEQKEALEALKEEVEQNPDLAEAQKEEILEPVENALEQLETNDLSQEEAVATLSEAEAELRDLAENSNAEALRRQLQSAGRPLADNPNSQLLGEALQNGNLPQAGAAVSQLADQLPSLSAEEQQQLAEDLAETAASLQGTDEELAAELAQAAEALRNGDVDAAQQALREAASTLQQRAQEAAAAQQAQSAAGQLSEGRQEVAQAGENGQSGQQGESGQGQQGESGQGQQGEGQEGQGSGQGEGDGSGVESLGPGNGAKQGKGAGGGHAEDVFVPDFTDLSDTEGTEVELPAECRDNPANCGQLLSETPTDFRQQGSKVPYNQVFGDYRDAAYEALDEDYIPLGMKGYVRDYFSSLEP